MSSKEFKQIEDKPFKVYVEGNIGSGKSTFLELLSENNMIEVFKEPLERWQNFEGINFFDLYYKDSYEYGLTFQLLTMLTILQRNIVANKKNDKPIHVFERSLNSSRQVFLETLVADQSVNFNSARVMGKWYDFLDAAFDNKPDLIIYIRTSPEKILKRIDNRGRTEEREIDLGYLQEIHSNHEAWIKCIKNTPVIVLNGDLTLDKLKSEFDICISSILKHYLIKKQKA